MSRSLSSVCALVSILWTSGAFGQTVTVGNLPPNPNFGFNQAPVTLIDLSNPASTPATLTSATFTWSAVPCPGAAKVKFFRPTVGGFAFLAERGPFNVTALTQTVPLSPPVVVAEGDFIAIGRLTACGSPVGQSPGAAQGFIGFGTDVTFNVTASQGSLVANSTLSVQATGIASPGGGNVVAVVPVVGSTPGAVGGAFFRSSVQLHNASSETESGRLVFHPQGATASAIDPAFTYSLPPGQTLSIPDLLPTIGQSGLGSLDVEPTSGTAIPVTLVRVFNDAGASGTTGFTEEPIAVGDALEFANRGVLVAPSDTTFFRFNVGVRTLGGGATLVITVRGSSGALKQTFTRTYAPNYFEQRDSTGFLNGSMVGPNDSITVQVLSGSAIVYGATIDNRTNDPSMQVAKRVP